MNADYGIARFEKRKTLQEIRLALLHIFREQNTPNADPAKYHLNESLIANYVNSTEDALARLNARFEHMAKQPRKNAVLAVEAVFTASSEAMQNLTVQQRREYFRDCVKWIVTMVGGQNIMAAQIHRCESVEHLHLVFTPIPKGENSLNYRKLFGGSKHRLSELQDEFHATVAAKYGFSRGVKGSRATHQSLSEYNKLVNSELPRLRAEKRELELECNDLEQKLSRGREALQALVKDIKATIEERANAMRYSLPALKKRLSERWGMLYEGKDKFVFEANEFIEEVKDRPTPRPSYEPRRPFR